MLKSNSDRMPIYVVSERPRIVIMSSNIASCGAIPYARKKSSMSALSTSCFLATLSDTISSQYYQALVMSHKSKRRAYILDEFPYSLFPIPKLLELLTVLSIYSEAISQLKAQEQA
jgi:hypothetical protein